MNENTVMQSKIDWLTLTRKVSSGETYATDDLTYRVGLRVTKGELDALNISYTSLETVPARRGFRLGFRVEPSGLEIHLGAQLGVQGIMLVASGNVLSTLGGGEALLYPSLRQGYRATRIDYAIDLFYSEYTALRGYEQYRMAHGGRIKRKTGYIEGRTGGTFYLGSRTSERYLRIYDKGKQLQSPLDWLRVEIEVKGELAERIAQVHYRFPRHHVYEIIGMLNMPHDELCQTLEAFVEGEEQAEITLPRKQTNREAWFYKQVLPAFEKLIKDDPAAALMIFDAMSSIVQQRDDV